MIEPILIVIGYVALWLRRRAIVDRRHSDRPDNLDFALLVIKANRGRLVGPGLIMIRA
jgi:nitrate reductase gamma subunit